VWHHVDASDRVLGKLAERIALVLMGKHKPIYDPAGIYLVHQDDSIATEATSSRLWRLCHRDKLQEGPGDWAEKRASTV
jgi:hypothetical protein